MDAAAQDSGPDFTTPILVALPIMAILAALVWVLLNVMQPAPPSAITIATGGPTGAYYGFGKRYAEILAKSGITLNVRTTAGAIENARLLAAPGSGVDLALMQGGIANKGTAPDVVSLGRLFPEPLWVFYRADRELDVLGNLKGRRVAIGPEGSGTRQLAQALLAANAIDDRSATLLPSSGGEAAAALRRGEIDALFLTMAPEAPLIRELARAPDVRLMNFSQADAYVRLYPYLQKIVLPRGAFDLVGDSPSRDVVLIAPVAALVARKGLHPALAGLMIDAVKAVHGGSGLFHSLREFPKRSDPEFDMAADAERYYQAGPSLLKRFLPFWLATFFERLIVIAIPLAGLAFPVIKGIPMAYKWRIRRRILFWYGRLKAVEARLTASRGAAVVPELKAEISRIDRAVETIRVPVAFSEDYYNLRNAIELVRNKIGQRAAMAIPNLT